MLSDRIGVVTYWWETGLAMFNSLSAFVPLHAQVGSLVSGYRQRVEEVLAI